MDKGLFRRLQEDLEIQEEGGGLTPADTLMLPDPLRKVVNLITRRRVMTVPELAEATGASSEEIAARLAELVEKGFVREMEVAGELKYKVIFARKRGRHVPLDLWASLGDKVE
jgi:predicted HTH transcriptional regulator